MKLLRHDAHYLDVAELAAKVRRSLDNGDNRRIYEMCGSANPAGVRKAVEAMVAAFRAPLAAAGGKWGELSLTFAIPRGAHRKIASVLHEMADPAFTASYGFRAASVPLAEDLDMLTLSLRRTR